MTEPARPALDADSLERVVPEDVEPGDSTGAETLRLHVERYEFAAGWARGRVLDIACGVGYGTRLLTDRGATVESALGVDLAESAISYAESHYANERTRFRVADATTFDDPDGFDTIVSIETVEHLPDPTVFSQRLVRLLRPGGMLVASVPVTPSTDGNPHHVSDFTERSFRRLFGRERLAERDALHQIQPFRPGGVLRRDERRMQEVRHDLVSYYATHPSVLVRRVWSTLRYGFTNRYLTLVWQRVA